jgi:hypothetical protein|tara:strand:- start:200 stop:1144 length:945 start_codon:yes stop_codon:yes gene_type:complete
MDSLRFPEQNNPNFKDRGLGDTIDRFTQATGIKWLVVTITQKLGVSCGCKQRRELFNKWFPYKQKKKMNKQITLEDILDPVSPRLFFQEYWGKKHLVIRRDKFKDLFTWENFNHYMNQYPNMKGLQILDYRKEDDGRWCLDKVRNGKLKLPMLSKKDIYNSWNSGKSIVLPFAEYQNKDMVDICHEFERYFRNGQSNVYCSPRANSKSFPAHSDQTENFLFHTEGKVKWTIYKEFAPAKPKEILQELILKAGDLLYIPQYQYHKVDTIGPRILLSVHFANKDGQELSNFKISKLGNTSRSKWYDWKPKTKNKKS